MEVESDLETSFPWCRWIRNTKEMQGSTAAAAGGAPAKAKYAAEMFFPPKSVFNLPYCAWRQRSGQPERAFERGMARAGGEKKRPRESAGAVRK